MVLRDVAQTIIDSAIRSSLPDEAVKRALKNCRFEKKGPSGCDWKSCVANGQSGS